MDVWNYLAILSALIWLIIWLLPWQAWQTNEVLEAEINVDNNTIDLSDITVIIPARNEAEMIGNTLQALAIQGQGLQVIVIDDHSEDETATIVKTIKQSSWQLITADALPEGWTGKLWAQHQGLALVNTPLTLLLDADIQLMPGMLASLKRKYSQQQLPFISLMAQLRLETFWEKWLMPAFIYFFKMLYPFKLVNHPEVKLAAAAGGCILVETQLLKKIGGLESIKNAVIDDCTLARTVKNNGYPVWLGLTHGVLSQRTSHHLKDIWQMVSRTAYTQLDYSLFWLCLCTIVMLILYIMPVIGLYLSNSSIGFLYLSSYLIMNRLYLPTLIFYRLNPLWSLTMPIIALFYLLMTWDSAIDYWRGIRCQWKGRVYVNS
jgi:hopene-associated glycosyltransferase HpnB